MGNPIRIQYEKSTRREAANVFAGVSATLLGLALFLFLFSKMTTLSWLFIIAFCAVGLVVYAIGIFYVVLNYRADGVFRCVVTADIIECDCPAPDCGQSFRLKIEEIAAIEQEKWSESERYYLCDLKGDRYWLTSNYDNPIFDILELLKSSNPKIETRIAE